MRTTLLLLFAVAALAGQSKTPPQPKTIPPLKTAERMALTDLQAKRAEIEKQIQQIIAEACADRGIALERCRIQPSGEFYELPAAKEAVK